MDHAIHHNMDMGHGGMDHGGHSGHGGMDHGDMDMGQCNMNVSSISHILRSITQSSILIAMAGLVDALYMVD